MDVYKSMAPWSFSPATWSASAPSCFCCCCGGGSYPQYCSGFFFFSFQVEFRAHDLLHLSFVLAGLFSLGVFSMFPLFKAALWNLMCCVALRHKFRERNHSTERKQTHSMSWSPTLWMQRVAVLMINSTWVKWVKVVAPPTAAGSFNNHSNKKELLIKGSTNESLLMTVASTLRTSRHSKRRS